MKILFVHTFYQHKGGEDSVFRNDLAEMSAHGHTVESLEFSNQPASFFKFILLPFNPFSYQRMRRKIRDFRPDLVHVHNFHFAASPSIIRAIKKEGIPCVVSLHNFRLVCPSAMLYYKKKLYIDSLSASFPWNAVWDRVYKNSWLMTFWLAFSNWINKSSGTWNMVDRFIVPGNYAKELIGFSNLPDFRDRIIVKPNYAEDPRQEKLTRNNVFVYVGRLSEEKGLETLLAAHALLNFELVIYGDGPMRPQVEKYVATHSNIVYQGHQTKQVLMAQLAESAALILPSVCMEMNPLTMIEAMSCGTPVIASDLGTLNEFIIDGYNGLRFESNNPRSLKDSVEVFTLLDQQIRDALSVNARKTFENTFTKEANYEAIMEVYKELTGQAEAVVQPA